jgi:threonine dehydratase
MGVVCQEVDLSNGYLSETDVCRLATGLGLTFDTHHDVSRGIEIPAYEAVLRESIAQGAVALDWIVVPVGAGVLFEDFVNYAEREGLPARVLGVAALRADSVADKLYALYSPYFDALNRFGQAAHDRYPRHRVIAVDDEAIRRVIPLLPPPMRAEPSAAAAFTVLESERLISAKSNVLLVNTGDGIISEG